MKELNVLGLIPARGGSKGIPGKNIRELAGKPLIGYAADCAVASKVLTRIILSTDSEEIASVGKSLGVEVPFLRPPELARDDTAMIPVIQHAIQQLEAGGWSPDIIVLLQPTAPLRKPGHISKALEIFRSEPCDSVVSVSLVPGHYHPHWDLVIKDGRLEEFFPGGLKTTRRQDLPPVYTRDGTIYLFTRKTIMQYNSIYGKKCLPLVVEAEDFVNLDSMKDWEMARQKLAEKKEAS